MSKHRILIVEDENLIGLGIEQNLIDFGYQVISVVDSGEKAIECVKIDKPDIILMDVQLNGKMDGIEAARIIQSEFDIPVIFLTAFSEESTISKVKQFQPIGYLIKPVQVRELKIVVEMALYNAKLNTDRKQIDEELRKRSLAVNQSASIFVITDLDGIIEYVNPAFSRITGYSSQEVIGKSTKILKSGKHPSRFYQKLWETILSGETWKGEMVNRKKDGKLYWEFAIISPVKNPDGKITHFVAIKEDISERKEMESQLLAAKKIAESANKAKSEFLAKMNHEIRSPMNGIIGMIEVLLDSDLSGEQRESAQIAKTSASHLLSLVNDNLDYSKIEANKLKLEKIKFNLRELVEELVDIESYQIKLKKLTFLYDIHQDVPINLIGDPVRLKQILINLISNALKFTDQGTISFQISLQSDQVAKTILKFEIEDTGIGISDSKQKDLFELYTQIDNSTSRKYGGTGLGLAICKQLVELIGGKIGVNSTEGKGSCFFFTAVFEKQATTEIEQSFSYQNINAAKVLIADNSQISQNIITRQLSNHGALCQTCNDFKDVIFLLLSGIESDDPFQLVIVDRNIGDGFEILGRSIKESKRLNEIPLVLLTSFGNKGEAVQAKNAGFSAYLPKPYKLGLFLKCLDNLLNNVNINGISDQDDLITQYSLREEIQQEVLDIQKDYHILLVDDSVVNQKIGSNALKKLGYNSTIANNGKACIALLEQNSFDLILMDCQMPIMDGYQTTKKIRTSTSIQINSNIPIVAMTADNSEESRDVCLQKGMDDFIVKPFVLKELGNTIQKWLPTEENKNNQWNKKGDTKTETKIKNQDDKQIFNKSLMMNRLVDDINIVKTVIEAFLKDSPQQIDLLVKHTEAADYINAKKLVHAIKGTAGNIGAEELYELAVDMEKNITFEEFNDKVFIFKEKYKKLESILKKELE
jgi:PAS domain S-box-containing protein